MDWKLIKEQLIRSDSFIRTELSSLNPVPERNGTRYKLDCPDCGQHEAYLYTNGEFICCNRQNKCGTKTSVFDYIATVKGKSTAPEDFCALIKELCVQYGIDCPEDTEQMKQRLAEIQKSKDALQAAHDIFRQALYAPEGKATLDYLHNVRHWNDTEIKEAGLGHNIGATALRKKLKLEGKPFPESLRYMNEREAHKITLPDYDQYGTLRGIWGRRTDDIKEKKYLPFGDSAGTKGFVPSGLNVKQSKLDKIIAVEGWLDWLRCKANGLDNVVAAGSNGLNETQIQAIKAICPNAVIIVAMDQDNAGAKGNKKTVVSLVNNNMDCVVAQIPNDPDGLVADYRKETGADTGGIEAFTQYIQNNTVITAGAYLAQQAIAGYDITSDLGRTQAEKALRTLCVNLADKKAIEDIVTFYGENENFTHSEDSFREDIEREYTQRVSDQENEKLNQTLRLALSSSTADKKFELMKKAVTEIETDNLNKSVPQPEPYTLDQYRDDISRTQHFNGFDTGFSDLNESGIKIPVGGITIITARPSECKTTFMLNLLVNMAKDYPKYCFIYASYEERSLDILRKAFSAYTGISPTISQIALQCKEEEEKEARELLIGKLIPRYQDVTDEKKDEAKKKVDAIIDQAHTFRDMLKAHRIFVINNADRYTASEIKHIAEQEINNGYNVGAVIVDYMQKIKVEHGTENGIRTYQVEATSEALRSLATERNIAVIVGAQANRDTAKERKEASCFPELHKIKDAGIIEQDASLVIGTACPAKHVNEFAAVTADQILKEHKKPQANKSSRTLICAKVLKHRNEADPADNLFCFAFGPSMKLEKITDQKEAEKLAQQIAKMTTGRDAAKKGKKKGQADEENNAAIDEVTAEEEATEEAEATEPTQKYISFDTDEPSNVPTPRPVDINREIEENTKMFLKFSSK